MSDIYQILDQLKIAYQKYQHPAVYTVEDAEKYDIHLEGAHSKNLFLRNKKADHYYLIVMESAKRADLKKLTVLLQEDRLSFASPDRLFEYLGVTPGAVSPFALIHDNARSVHVIVDKELLAEQKIGFHPCVNTATLIISTDDFKKFLEWTKNRTSFVAL